MPYCLAILRCRRHDGYDRCLRRVDANGSFRRMQWRGHRHQGAAAGEHDQIRSAHYFPLPTSSNGGALDRSRRVGGKVRAWSEDKLAFTNKQVCFFDAMQRRMALGLAPALPEARACRHLVAPFYAGVINDSPPLRVSDLAACDLANDAWLMNCHGTGRREIFAEVPAQRMVKAAIATQHHRMLVKSF